MALRYITTGNFPDQQSQARGTLLDILTSQGSPNTLADADDVPGVRLEWLNGAWYGDCGFPSAAQHSALLAANAYNSLGLGSRATLPSGPVTWRGASVGWVDAPDPLNIAGQSLSAIRAVVIGDSQTQGDNPYNVNQYQNQFATPWPTWMTLASGGRITMLKNVAISGQKSDQMLARFQTDVLAFDPDAVFIAASINNTGLSTLKPDVIEMVRLCKSYRSARVKNGIRVWLVTTPPTGDYDGSPAAQPGDAQKISDMNNWKRYYAFQNGLGLIDFYEYFVDPSGTYKNGATTDGVHPVNAWQKTAGEFAWTSISKAFDGVCPLLPQANNDPNNLFPNPMMLPTQSARPSGWVTYGGGTMTESCGTVAGFRGNAFKAVNSGAGVQYYERSVSLTGRGGNLLRISLQASTTQTTGLGTFKWQGGSQNGNPALQVTPVLAIADGSEFATEVSVPSDATGLLLQYAVQPGQTTTIGAVGIFDLTTMGALT